MKKNIHPKYYEDSKASCACGNSFTTGSTLKEIHTEICSKCHPFYTGKQKLVDTAQRVEKFQAKIAKQKTLAHLKGKKTKRAIKTAVREAKQKGEK